MDLHWIRYFGLLSGYTKAPLETTWTYHQWLITYHCISIRPVWCISIIPNKKYTTFLSLRIFRLLGTSELRLLLFWWIGHAPRALFTKTFPPWFKVDDKSLFLQSIPWPSHRWSVLNSLEKHNYRAMQKYIVVITMLKIRRGWNKILSNLNSGADIFTEMDHKYHLNQLYCFFFIFYFSLNIDNTHRRIRLYT